MQIKRFIMQMKIHVSFHPFHYNAVYILELTHIILHSYVYNKRIF